MSEPGWVYSFDETPPGDAEDARRLLGGKGASLAAMCRAGLHVPPGFTITTEACRHFFEHGEQWPDGLEAQIRAHLSRLESETGRRFGSGGDPAVLVRRAAMTALTTVGYLCSGLFLTRLTGTILAGDLSPYTAAGLAFESLSAAGAAYCLTRR